MNDDFAIKIEVKLSNLEQNKLPKLIERLYDLGKFSKRREIESLIHLCNTAISDIHELLQKLQVAHDDGEKTRGIRFLIEEKLHEVKNHIAAINEKLKTAEKAVQEAI